MCLLDIFISLMRNFKKVEDQTLYLIFNINEDTHV